MKQLFVCLVALVAVFEGLRLGMAFDFLALKPEGKVTERRLLRYFDVTYHEARKVRSNLLWFFAAGIPAAFLFGDPFGWASVIGLVIGCGFMLAFGPGLIQFCIDRPVEEGGDSQN